MANTYTWKVGQCDRTLSDGMITTLHYTITATTEDGVYSAGAYGSVGLEAADPSDMVAYDDVSGQELDPKPMMAAGKDEIQYF